MIIVHYTFNVFCYMSQTCRDQGKHRIIYQWTELQQNKNTGNLDALLMTWLLSLAQFNCIACVKQGRDGGKMVACIAGVNGEGVGWQQLRPPPSIPTLTPTFPPPFYTCYAGQVGGDGKGRAVVSPPITFLSLYWRSRLQLYRGKDTLRV